MRVLAIDPGFGRNGFAVLENSRQHNADLLFSECFETDKDLPFYDRLLLVANRMREHITTYQPDCVALETLFFSKNQKTVMEVAEIRGGVILVAREHGLPVAEYGPSTVKVSVTGDGRANKQSILRMIHRLIRIDEKKRYDDEYDAIAIGITHVLASRRGTPSSSP